MFDFARTLPQKEKIEIPVRKLQLIPQVTEQKQVSSCFCLI